ncbi:unnamed protein product [Lota lota]
MRLCSVSGMSAFRVTSQRKLQCFEKWPSQSRQRSTLDGEQQSRGSENNKYFDFSKEQGALRHARKEDGGGGGGYNFTVCHSDHLASISH